ncbi:MAG: 5-formyltetrahydrofolate cyclo-ligase [Candidatus Aenigmatarchaeota archaeon]
MKIEYEKKKLRERIWKLLEKECVARFPFPIKGRIPNFEGSEKAAELLRNLPEWKNAKVIFSSPDYAQKKVRELALKDGKMLIVATPKIKKGYLVIKPEDVKGREEIASTIKGAFKYGNILKNLIKPDLIIIGSVAVDKFGYRLGKGGGYGDREIKTFLEMFGKITIATTIHELQVVEMVPRDEHDTKVDYIVTQKRIIPIQDSEKII